MLATAGKNEGCCTPEALGSTWSSLFYVAYHVASKRLWVCLCRRFLVKRYQHGPIKLNSDLTTSLTTGTMQRSHNWQAE